MTTIKMPGHEFAQCRIRIHADGTTELFSYTTRVIAIGPDGWLYCTGTYSMTTRKHISWFMREYGKGASYYTAKACYEKSLRYNVNTKEVCPL